MDSSAPLPLTPVPTPISVSGWPTSHLTLPPKPARSLKESLHYSFEEQQSAGRGGEEAGPSGVSPGAGGRRNYLDAMSDDEMEGEDGGRGPQMSRSFNAITPAQIALLLEVVKVGSNIFRM